MNLRKTWRGIRIRRTAFLAWLTVGSACLAVVQLKYASEPSQLAHIAGIAWVVMGWLAGVFLFFAKCPICGGSFFLGPLFQIRFWATKCQNCKSRILRDIRRGNGTEQ